MFNNHINNPNKTKVKYQGITNNSNGEMKGNGLMSGLSKGKKAVSVIYYPIKKLNKLFGAIDWFLDL